MATSSASGSQSATHTGFAWPTVTLFALLLIGLGGGIGFGLAILVRPVPTQQNTRAAATSANLQDLELRYQMVKGQLDAVADNARQISTLIALLLTLTSLYALALGLNSWICA
ncbi:MAG TPA: hypothetical protein VG168_09765 [Bryobacteraceae bacterium]|nr:hypothetical protein [Bryobacteraceae bacterium]